MRGINNYGLKERRRLVIFQTIYCNARKFIRLGPTQGVISFPGHSQVFRIYLTGFISHTRGRPGTITTLKVATVRSFALNRGIVTDIIIVCHIPETGQNGSAVHSTPSRLLSARLVHCYCLINTLLTATGESRLR